MMNQTSIQTETIAIEDVREFASAGHLYAILDACDAPLVPEKVNELGPERAASLYRGIEEEEYWAVAPYLVSVDTDLFDWIVSDLWLAPWGIFAVADADLPSLRRHFRHFLVVRDPKGEQMYFRFYDPRVLGPFLTTCNCEELIAIFGPCKILAVGWGHGAESIATYRVMGEGKRRSVLVLDIRTEQFHALESVQEERFIDRLVDSFRPDFSEACEMTPEEIRPAVAEQVRKASSYGLETEDQIALYVMTAWLMGNNFDQEFSAVHDVLTSVDYVPAAKADWLEGWIQQVLEPLEAKDEA